MRPDHFLFDDIDNSLNTKNRRLIEEDISHIRGEIIGAGSDPQIVWLGNVIRQHGRNPSQREYVRNNKNRIVFEIFIYGEKGKRNGTPVWSRFVETDEEKEAQHAL